MKLDDEDAKDQFNQELGEAYIEPGYKVTHSFYIAGVKFHQMATIINEMNEGDHLNLIPEPTNKFDPNAIRIEYATFEKEIMCGYVPRKYSSEVGAMITIGKKLECVVIKLSRQAKPWDQCKVEIREVTE